jgi:hypothetical protein
MRSSSAPRRISSVEPRSPSSRPSGLQLDAHVLDQRQVVDRQLAKH